MLKGMIAINDPNGVYNPYIPPGTYIHVTREYFKLHEEYTKCAIDDCYIPSIHVIVIENNELINCNQQKLVTDVIKRNIKELKILAWNSFKIDRNPYHRQFYKLQLLGPVRLI